MYRLWLLGQDEQVKSQPCFQAQEHGVVLVYMYRSLGSERCLWFVLLEVFLLFLGIWEVKEVYWFSGQVTRTFSCLQGDTSSLLQ